MIRSVRAAALASACVAVLAGCETTPAYPVNTPTPAPAAAPAPAVATPPPVAEAPPPAYTPPPTPPAAIETTPLPPPTAAPPQAVQAPVPNPPSRTQAPARETPPARLVATGRVVPATGMFRDYVVRKGDHVDEIARDLETTRATIVEANHLKAPYALRPGQHLNVPVEKAYVAVAGDTLADIARRFGVPLADLADLNGLSERARVPAGERIALPAAYEDHGPVRAETPTYARASYAPSSSRPWRAHGYHPDVGGYTPSSEALAAAQSREGAAASSAAQPAAVDTTSPEARAAIAAAGRGRFLWPVRGEVIQAFGATGLGRRNDGIDLRAPLDAVVTAAAAGDVVYAGDQVPGFGNLVLVKHADGWVTAYAHLDKITVQMRDTVTQGQQIGLVGTTGGVSEPQLHFEVRYAPSVTDKARPIDPLLVLPK